MSRVGGRRPYGGSLKCPEGVCRKIMVSIVEDDRFFSESMKSP